MQKSELTISGTVVWGDEFEAKDGYVVIENGAIKEIGEEKTEAAIEGIVIPAFVNAHTHIGDSVAKEPDFMPLEQLVGPGGFKHKVLADTPYETLVSAIEDTVKDMVATGTQMFADFREGGVLGVRALKEALYLAGGEERLRVKTFGRPADGTSFGTEDINGLFESVDGIGMSSVADYPLGVVKVLAAEAKSRKKMFALHAGERNAEDIKDAIELEPDFIVHLLKASPQDFEKMHDNDIAAVVCIRSNQVTGLGLPPLRQMLEAGLTVGAGTDNVMLNAPDIFAELEFISKLFRLDAREVLKMVTHNSAKVLNESESVGAIEEGKKANLLVIRTDTPNMRNVRDPIRGVVRRATRNDIAAVIHEGKVAM